MSDNNPVLILMTTYNGEKYIQEQLCSIMNQSYHNWKLLIQDDASKDNTVLILKKYENMDERIHVLHNHSDRHGAYFNFWSLIAYAKTIDKADYYFFADQDDIWLENKLEIMIHHAINGKANNQPLMIYADMEIIDDYGNTIYPSINNVMGIGEMKGLSLFFTHGFLWGCDLMINHKLFDAVPVVPLEYEHINIMSHDNYYGKFAAALGCISFIPQVLIKHRRHIDNVTGNYNIKLSILKVLRQLLFGFERVASIHGRVYNQTLFALRQMKRFHVQFNEIESIEHAIQYGGIRGVLTLKRYGVKRKQLSRTLGIYGIFFMGSYKKYLFYNE